MGVAELRFVGQEASQLADRSDCGLVIAGAGDHVEPGAAGLDVGAQELRDLLGP